MNPPFSAEEFFGVFRNYNEALFPAPLILYLLAGLAILLLTLPGSFAGRLIAALLGLMWVWAGAAYHIAFFSEVNPAAYGFGGLFILQGLLFFRAGYRTELLFRAKTNLVGLAGWLLIAYAVLVYPLLSWLFGHHYPEMPTFGLPCPLTIFTFGILLMAGRPFSRWLLAIPTLWALIGFTAVLAFGIYQDAMLLLSALITWLLIGARPFPEQEIKLQEE